MARPAPGSRPRRTSLIIAAAITGVIFLLIVAIGVYGLIIGPPDRSEPEAPPPGQSETPRSPTNYVPPIADTTDAERFATSVSHALFTWDTHTTLTPHDYREPLLEVADPTGHETNGLVADLDNYLPDQETWVALQEYQTRQWLEIDEVFVPEEWEEAVAVGGESIVEGTIAYTVTGTRHREGVWHGEDQFSEHQVAFTMFITCPPGGEACHLLRLSLLDQPLQ